MKMILNETQEQRDLELSELIGIDLDDVRGLMICAPESIRIYDGKKKIETEKEMIDLYRKFDYLNFPAYLRTLMKTSVERRHRELINLLRKTKRKRCLDFGCGIGTHAIALLENNNIVSILDIDESPLLEFAIKRIERRNFNVHVIKHTEKLATKFFDVVICSDTLEHVFDPIREIQRIADTMRTDAILHLQISDMIKPSSGHFPQTIHKWRKHGAEIMRVNFKQIGKTIYKKR